MNECCHKTLLQNASYCDGCPVDCVAPTATRQDIHDEIVRQAGHEYYSPPLHGSGVRAPVANQLRDLIDRYWSLAYAEGKEGRDHDTEDGAAQQCRHEIEEVLRTLDGVKEGGNG